MGPFVAQTSSLHARALSNPCAPVAVPHEGLQRAHEINRATKQQGHHMKTLKFVAGDKGIESVKNQTDKAALAQIIELLSSKQFSVYRGNALDYVCDRSGESRLRVYALFRKYGEEITHSIGARTMSYYGAVTMKSGRGAFGRLGGSGLRSRKDTPRAWFEF